TQRCELVGGGQRPTEGDGREERARARLLLGLDGAGEVEHQPSEPSRKGGSPGGEEKDGPGRRIRPCASPGGEKARQRRQRQGPENEGGKGDDAHTLASPPHEGGDQVQQEGRRERGED